MVGAFESETDFLRKPHLLPHPLAIWCLFGANGELNTRLLCIFTAIVTITMWAQEIAIWRTFVCSKFWQGRVFPSILTTPWARNTTNSDFSTCVTSWQV